MKGWSVHTISITVRAPVLCQGLAALAAGVDASALRDSAGRPILPGDQIKGLIRAFARDMQPDAVMELFGPEHGDEDTAKTGFEPARGAIIVSDCALVETAPPQADPMAKFTGPPSWTPWVPAALPERMRVEIDDDLGRAKDGHLLFAESVAPSGTLLRFEGRIHVREAQAGRLDLIRHALSAIPAFGAYRSIGWGEHVSALSAITPAASRNPVTLTDRSADRIAITVSFDRPLLVDAARTAHNVFTGAQVLPGAVIKGALASALAGSKGWLDGPAGDALSDCRITHAWPLDAHGEPICRALPRSLVSGRDGDGQLVIADMALAGTNESAALIGGLAAFYTPDWKGDQFSAAKAALGWSQADDPVREQRTRVKIGADGVAEDRNLFVYEAVRETMDDGAARQWRLEMDRGDADRDAFLALLDALAGGLAGIGKTDAVMTVHDMAPVPAPGVVDPYEAGNRDHWVVTLASPAMMLDPDEKTGRAGPVHGLLARGAGGAGAGDGGGG